MPVLRRMWADGGPRGLFRGNLVTVVKTFPSSAIQFAAYDLCKEVLRAYSGPGGRGVEARVVVGAGPSFWTASGCPPAVLAPERQVTAAAMPARVH
jgi:hypothetical protein